MFFSRPDGVGVLRSPRLRTRSLPVNRHRAALTSPLPRTTARIRSGRSHVAEAARGNGLGVFVNGDQVARAALGDRAERFLENRREPAGLVAGRRIVVHLAALARRVILPPLDARDELLADVVRNRAPRQ